MAKPREENLIFILGARGVGKTSLKNVISGREFNEKEAHSKIGITTSYLTVDDKNYCIKELTDNDNFSETKNLKYRLEEILLIFVVFSVDDENSLEYAKEVEKLTGLKVKYTSVRSDLVKELEGEIENILPLNLINYGLWV